MAIQFVIVDYPEALSIYLLGLAMFGFKFKGGWTRILVITFFWAAAQVALTLLEVPFTPKICCLVSTLALLIRIIQKKSFIISISISAISFLGVLTAEGAIVQVYSWFGVSIQDILASPALMYGGVSAYSVILFIIAGLMRKFNFDLRRFVPRTKYQKALNALIASAVVVAFLIFGLTYYYIQSNKFEVERFHENLMYFIFPLSAAFTVMIVYLWRYLKIRAEQVEQETEAPYTKQLTDLSVAVRSIKHDALSHYTVLASYLKLGEYKRAASYLQDLVKEAQHVISTVQGVHNPTLAALIHSKSVIFASHGIDLQIRIDERAPQFCGWKPIDVAKVLGNLLDNAQTAALQTEDMDDAYVLLYWTVRAEEEILVVENTGPGISEEGMAKLWDLGYTTRASGEGGVGLPVVRAIVTRYGGVITAQSKNGVTRFTIKLPIKTDTASA